MYLLLYVGLRKKIFLLVTPYIKWLRENSRIYNRIPQAAQYLKYLLHYIQTYQHENSQSQLGSIIVR